MADRLTAPTQAYDPRCAARDIVHLRFVFPRALSDQMGLSLDEASVANHPVIVSGELQQEFSLSVPCSKTIPTVYITKALTFGANMPVPVPERYDFHRG